MTTAATQGAAAKTGKLLQTAAAIASLPTEIGCLSLLATLNMTARRLRVHRTPIPGSAGNGGRSCAPGQMGKRNWRGIKGK